MYLFKDPNHHQAIVGVTTIIPLRNESSWASRRRREKSFGVATLKSHVGGNTGEIYHDVGSSGESVANPLPGRYPIPNFYASGPAIPLSIPVAQRLGFRGGMSTVIWKKRKTRPFRSKLRSLWSGKKKFRPARPKIELKYCSYDYPTWTALTGETNAFWDYTSDVELGYGLDQRIGRKISLKHFKIDYIFRNPNTNTGSVPCMRILVVQSFGERLAIGDLPATLTSICDHSLMRVLCDQIIMFQNWSWTSAGGNVPMGDVKTWSYFHKFPAGRNNVTFSVANVATKNAIYMRLIIEDTGANPLDYKMVSRLAYWDP